MPDCFIEVITGNLGGGKSYFAVERMVALWRQGGVCFTNLEVRWENVKKYFVDEFSLELDDRQLQIIEQSDVAHFVNHLQEGTDEIPVMCVLDEIHLAFNARKWQNADEKVLEFLTQARKMSVHILLISQHQDNIDKQFRRMVEYVWIIRDMQKFRIPLLKCTWPLPQMVRVCHDARNPKIIHARDWVFKNKKIFSLYNSKAKFTDFRMKKIVTSLHLKKVKKPKGKRMFRFAVISIGLVCFLIYGTLHIFSFFNEPLEVKAPIPSTAQVVDFSEIENLSDPLRVLSCAIMGDEVWISFSDGRIVDQTDPLLQMVRKGAVIYDGKTYRF